MTTLTDQLKQGADQAWTSLSEGWRELSARASGALTRFWPSTNPSHQERSSSSGAAGLAPPATWPRLSSWAFLAADVFDEPDKLTVRIETPGLQRDDFNVEVQGDLLTVWGEKPVDREASDGRWQVVQCAYGRFRRDVVLPVPVKADQTRASYRDGVLRI